MDRKRSVPERVLPCTGDGAESSVRKAESPSTSTLFSFSWESVSVPGSPSFFSRLTDYQLGCLASFVLVHEEHVYAFVHGSASRLDCICYTCGVGRSFDLRKGGETL